MNKVAVLFGGGGFIGSYLAVELLEQNIVDEVLLADLHFQEPLWPKRLHQLRVMGKVATCSFDVRRDSDYQFLPKQAELIVNLAAVHREPGHAEHEYYETNLPGAENICNWANTIDCKQLIFTSSIATYGANEDLHVETKTETSTPKPNTPYGISKLKAEAIHKQWQEAEPDRRLLIVRPGVIFGAGENGNVTRMLKAIKRGYFVYTGNQDTAKAGGYVKELTRSVVWMWQKQLSSQKPFSLYNFTMNPTPTVGQFVKAISAVLGKDKQPISLPFNLLLLMAKVWELPFKLIGQQTSINPARIHKLRRSNKIAAEVLAHEGYEYQYDLVSAMRDWKSERAEDWQ